MVSQATWLLLIGLMSFTSAADLTKTKNNAPSQESFIDQCTPVPTWTVGAEQAISLVGQNITVIALLNSSRPFGRQQAAMLSLLRSRLYDAGFPSINFMVIDSMSATGKADLHHERSSIPVYQEQRGEPVREILGAGNDHILVLDRCGRMTYQVITPFSKLTNPYVKAAILSTYKDNPCGVCHITSDEIQIPNTEENDTSMVYASDAPHQAECKFDYCRDSATNLTVSTEQDISDRHYKTLITRSNQLQGETPNRENGLSQSFIQTTDVPKSPEMYQMHEIVSQQIKAENVSSPYEMSSSNSAESVDLALITGHNRSILHDSHMQQPHDDIVRGYLGQMRNWDWSENQNNQSEIRGLEKSTEQSVEVVHQANASKRMKKRKKKKRKGTAPNVKGTAQDCEPFQQFQEELPSSYEASDASMEKLVNQTQLLINWYQQQMENGTSSEEKYEISDILKSKIIEHYKKLRPWLNYKLAPKVEN